MEANANVNAGAGANLNYVERTIDEATFRIGQLQDLVKGLHLLREWAGGGAAVRNHELRELHENGKEEPARKKKAPPAAVQTSGPGPGRGAVPNGIGKRVEGVIEELVGEFDARMVAAELPGERFESVRNAVSYLVKQGRLAGVPGKRGWFRPASGTGKGKKATGGNGGGHGPGRKLVEQAAVVRGLAEPFGSAEIMAATGSDKKEAQNFLTQGKLKGWLERVEHGSYRRGKGYPKGEAQEEEGEEGKAPAGKTATAGRRTPNAGAREEAQRIPPSPPPMPDLGLGTVRERELKRAELEDALAQCQKDLTKHERAGQVTIAGIMREKVLRLQREIEELEQT